MGYLGEFEQLILFSVLHLGDEAYGVSIREMIEDRTGRSVSTGAIYTALGRLETRGMVASRTAPPEPGKPGRPKKYYRLRQEGARALKDAYSRIQAIAGSALPALIELAES